MAPLINQEIGLRRDPITQDSASEVSEPVLAPTAWESPLSASLPRTAAGQARTRRALRFDWFELSTVGLGLACAALSVYRLLWAIH